MITICIAGKERQFPEGITAGEAVRALMPEGNASDVLCTMRNGESIGLSRVLSESCELIPLTYSDDEGRRTYERSLRFLFLMSIHRLFPGQRVRVLNSIGHGIYYRLRDVEMTGEMVRSIKADMLELIRQDLPFETCVMNIPEAEAYCLEQGWEDKISLLKYRSVDHVRMYKAGDFSEYFYGSMLPSTGCLNVFELLPHFPGAVLMLPDPKAPGQPAVYESHAKFLRQFHVSQEWCSILGAENVADVNHMLTDGDFRDFIRVSETLHDLSISRAAQELLSRGSRLVMIFGPSSSGKTTFANRLGVYLRTMGKKTHLMSLDDFYRDVADLPVEADGTPDLEHVDALDVPLLISCLEGLLAGHRVDMPRYDFKRHGRSAESVPLQLAPDEILIIEGIHGMNPRITSQLPEHLTYGIYVSALGCINLDDHNRIRTTDLRLLRRIVRDMRARNTTPRETIAMWAKVRAGEDKWIFPNQEKADLMVNTSLHYELPLLRRYAWDVLTEIKPEEPGYLIAHRLTKFLQYVLPMPDRLMDEIPPMSILREFIGNSSFYDKH